MKNYMKLELSARSENESFARSTVAAFALPLNPSLSDLSDVKTAVSEAVTNCIVHAYGKGADGDKIVIECSTEKEGLGGVLHIKITDYGCGIEDVDRAITPFFTTLPSEERSGMGFTIMQTFTDGFSIVSEKGKGTVVTLVKRVGGEALCSATMENREKEGLNA